MALALTSIFWYSSQALTGTGTLTVGEMTVRALYVADQRYEVTGEGYGPDGEVRFEGKKAETPHAAPLLELATVLLGCNHAHLVQEEGKWKTVGDPTEGALLAAGRKAGGERERIDDRNISSRVKTALAEDPQFKYDGVNVETFKGVVQ